MRLEILVGNDEPQIFPLSKPKIVLGTHESCDIVLSNDGISRKHLIVITDGDQYFLVDQGSSNGSYVNNQRLIPGQKVEFTSFFPVRLGNDVILSLLSDDDPDSDIEVKSLNDFSQNESAAHSSTRVINLKDLNSVKTEKLYTEKKQNQQKLRSRKISEKTTPKKEKTKWNWGKIIPSLIILGAFFHKFDGYQMIQSFIEGTGVVKSDQPMKVVNKNSKKVPATAAAKIATENTQVAPVKVSLTIDQADLTPVEKISELKREIKCISEAERYFCEKIPKLREENFGAYQRLSMIHIFLNADSEFLQAYDIVMKSPNALTAGPDDLQKWLNHLTFLIFLKNGLPVIEITEENKLKDLNITLVLTFQNYNKLTETKIFAGKMESIIALKSLLEERHFQNIKSFGMDSVEFTKDYFRIY